MIKRDFGYTSMYSNLTTNNKSREPCRGQYAVYTNRELVSFPKRQTFNFNCLTFIKVLKELSRESHGLITSQLNGIVF